jgi:hypothetical protein
MSQTPREVLDQSSASRLVVCKGEQVSRQLSRPPHCTKEHTFAASDAESRFAKFANPFLTGSCLDLRSVYRKEKGINSCFLCSHHLLSLLLSL